MGAVGSAPGLAAIPPALAVVAFFLAFVGIGLFRLRREVLRERERERRRGAARSRRLARALRDGDAPFELPRFLARIARAYGAAHEACSRQDLAAARPFLSDGVYERFASEIEEQRSLGDRTLVTGVRVEHVELLEVRRSETFDTAAVRVDAWLRHHRVDRASRRKLSFTGRDQEVREVWSLLRRSGARSDTEAGLLEARCPTCAAPLEPGPDLDALRCAACGGGLRGALCDWVLTGITQLAAWQPREQRPPPGLRALRELDPGFTLEHLEDRAAVLFRRHVDALRRGELAGLVPVASPDFLERHRAEIEPGESGPSYVGECAIAGVRTRGVLVRSGRVCVLVEIRFSGETFRRAAQGPPEPVDALRRRRDHRSLYVLARRPDARSDLERCLLSAHCPRCGAPVARAARGDCAWCGEVLNDGHGDWVLADVLPSESKGARALLAELPGATRMDVAALGGPTRAGLLAWAAALALCDRLWKPEENEALLRIGERLEVPRSELASLAAAAQRGDLEATLPEGPEQARAWLRILIDLAASDGALAAEERALLHSLAAQSGVGADEIEQWIARSVETL